MALKDWKKTLDSKYHIKYEKGGWDDDGRALHIAKSESVIIGKHLKKEYVVWINKRNEGLSILIIKGFDTFKQALRFAKKYMR